MEFIIENADTKMFVKVNGKQSPGIAFLRIFQSEAEAQEYLEQNLPHDDALRVVKYEGFTS